VPCSHTSIEPLSTPGAFLGGTRDDFGEDIAVDASGRGYVTGRTDSSDYPTTSGAFDTTFNSGAAFVTKLPTS
jgi:Beta-propeller repeat